MLCPRSSCSLQLQVPALRTSCSGTGAPSFRCSKKFTSLRTAHHWKRSMLFSRMRRENRPLQFHPEISIWSSWRCARLNHSDRPGSLHRVESKGSASTGRDMGAGSVRREQAVCRNLEVRGISVRKQGMCRSLLPGRRQPLAGANLLGAYCSIRTARFASRPSVPRPSVPRPSVPRPPLTRRHRVGTRQHASSPRFAYRFFRNAGSLTSGWRRAAEGTLWENGYKALAGVVVEAFVSAASGRGT